MRSCAQHREGDMKGASCLGDKYQLQNAFQYTLDAGKVRLDSICMSYLEQSKSQSHKVRARGPGVRVWGGG